jgi:hypothetical protein
VVLAADQSCSLEHGNNSRQKHSERGKIQYDVATKHKTWTQLISVYRRNIYTQFVLAGSPMNGGLLLQIDGWKTINIYRLKEVSFVESNLRLHHYAGDDNAVNTGN